MCDVRGNCKKGSKRDSSESSMRSRTEQEEEWKQNEMEKETEPIWRMFHWAYSTPSHLLVYDRNRLHTTLQSREGVRQGDPFAAFGFALGVQQLYESANVVRTIHILPLGQYLCMSTPRLRVASSILHTSIFVWSKNNTLL